MQWILSLFSLWKELKIQDLKLNVQYPQTESFFQFEKYVMHKNQRFNSLLKHIVYGTIWNRNTHKFLRSENLAFCCDFRDWNEEEGVSIWYSGNANFDTGEVVNCLLYHFIIQSQLAKRIFYKIGCDTYGAPLPRIVSCKENFYPNVRNRPSYSHKILSCQVWSVLQTLHGWHSNGELQDSSTVTKISII